MTTNSSTERVAHEHCEVATTGLGRPDTARNAAMNRSQPRLSILLAFCFAMALPALSCSKRGTAGTDVDGMATASASAASAPPNASAEALASPEFFGVYLRDGSGRLVALKETKEEKKALPKPAIRNGMPQSEAVRILSMPTKYELYFTAPTTSRVSIPAATLAKNGFIIYLEKFVELRLGACEPRDDRLVEIDKRHGFIGEEVGDLVTKKLKDNTYQVLPKTALPAGHYYVWIQSTAEQRGFTSAFPFDVE